MVKLKENKLQWAFKRKQKDAKNKHLAPLVGVGIRRFQQLYAEYKMTGKIPELKKGRRPKTNLTDGEKALIDNAVTEGKLSNAVAIRLHIKKYHNKTLSRAKIHKYLLIKKVSKPDKKKQKQRKYCRYERKHSFSLVHLDWHESKVVTGKWVCAVEDDASRLILAGGEFDHATTENSIALMKAAIEIASEYCSVIRSANTDKGSQFYANKRTEKNEKGECKFELFLKSVCVRHIPSRRNHPQTNGKEERWFRTYEENRMKFASFEEFISWYNNRIHLGLSRKAGITPYEAALHKLRQESWIGLFSRRFG